MMTSLNIVSALLPLTLLISCSPATSFSGKASASNKGYAENSNFSNKDGKSRNRDLQVVADEGQTALEDNANDSGDENQYSYETCVEKVGSSSYSASFEPCEVTLYEVPSSFALARLSFDSVKDEDEADNVSGVLRTCSVLEGFSFESFNEHYLNYWNDPCVGLEKRCYDWEQLTPSQQDDVRDMIGDRSITIDEDRITHVSIDCTHDFEEKEEFQDNIDDAATILGLAFWLFWVCCCGLCCVLPAVITGLVVFCIMEQQRPRHGPAREPAAGAISTVTTVANAPPVAVATATPVATAAGVATPVATTPSVAKFSDPVSS